MRFGIHDDHRRDDFHARMSGNLLHDGAEVGVRDTEFFGVPGYVAVVLVVLDDQLAEVPANHFAFRQVGPFVADALIQQGNPFVYVRIEVEGYFLFGLIGQVLVKVNHQLEITFRYLHSFLVQRTDGFSQGMVHGIKQKVGMLVLFDVLRGESENVNLQLSFDAVDLEDASRGQRYQTMRIYLDFVQVQCGFYRPFDTKYKNFAFQPDRKIGIQSKQLFVDVCSGQPVFRQVYFRQFFIHR